MTVIPTALGITAGICVLAGLLHAIIGLVRRPFDWMYITFSISALAASVNSLSVSAIHTAESLESFNTAFKYGFGISAAGWVIGVIWFVAFYTDVKPLPFLLVMSSWFLLIICLQLILPLGILFESIENLRLITLPWGEQSLPETQGWKTGRLVLLQDT